MGENSENARDERDEPDHGGPDAVCWEYQAGELPIRLSFSIKVF